MTAYEKLIEGLGSPEAVQQYIMQILHGAEQRPDLPHVKLTVVGTLAKFDGEYEPGKQPVEVIESKMEVE